MANRTVSPCRNCGRIDESKEKCLRGCEKLKAFQETVLAENNEHLFQYLLLSSRTVQDKRPVAKKQLSRIKENEQPDKAGERTCIVM
jgi:hypothetical protein